MAKKTEKKRNLPAVSRQTAGGITGAVLGAVVAGPVGAVAGGVAGALVGDSSAKGNKPIKRAMDTIRSKLRGGTSDKPADDQGESGRTAKKSKTGPGTKKRAAKSVGVKTKTKPTTAGRKKKKATASKARASSNRMRANKGAKKKRS